MAWFKKWGLKVNWDKTRHINFGVSKMNIWIDGNHIKKGKEIKFLGLKIDKKINLIQHLTEKIKSTYKILNHLSTLKHQYSLSKPKFLMLYKTLLRSKLEYSHICLLSMSKTQLHKLEITQNKALRLILNKPRWTKIIELYKEANISSIENRLKTLAKN